MKRFFSRCMSFIFGTEHNERGTQKEIVGCENSKTQETYFDRICGSVALFGCESCRAEFETDA